MKKIGFIALFISLIFSISGSDLKAGIIDELYSVPQNSDILFYADFGNTINFLRKKGININDIDELASEDPAGDGEKIIKDFNLKPSDIREVIFAGRFEELEKKSGFIIFIDTIKGKGNIPAALKIKSSIRKGLTLYSSDEDENIVFTRIGNCFLIGSKGFIEQYIDNRQTVKKSSSHPFTDFIKNSSGKQLYFRLTVSKYISETMEKAFQQGAMMAKGIRENVFLKALLNLQSMEYGVQLDERIHLFSGMQGLSPADGEKFVMLSHFSIVGTSFLLSFADMIAARNEDSAIGKVTDNSDFISTLQQIVGRMSAKQSGNGAVISFHTTEKETGTLIAFINKSITDIKKDRAEKRESLKISAITAAIIDNDTAKAEQLINDKIDINRKDADGNTILATAALMGNMKIVKLALARGAYIDQKSFDGMTPLHNAAKGGSSDMVNFLLSKGADISIRNEIEMTALHFNAQQGNAEVTKILIAAGADVNAIAMDGTAPLHIACEEGYIDIVKLLSENKADLTLRDGNQERGIDIADRNEHSQIVKYFKDNYNLEPEQVLDDDSFSEENNDDY